MFASELNGYNRAEVDRFIAKLKAEHETAMMEEKLKVLESERKLLDYKNKNLDIENREKNIKSALDAFRRFQDEGNNNIKSLHYEQIKMIHAQLQILYRELTIQFSGVQNSQAFKKIFVDLETILKQAENCEKMEITSPTKTENDSMRMLLNKMQGYRSKGQDLPREIKITRASDGKNQIRPVCDIKLEENDQYDTLADKFLSTKPAEIEERRIRQEMIASGFDLKEAINPKDDLAEIMKAFDFYAGNSGINT